MAESIPYLRIFLSSPGDVNEERQSALRVMKQFPNRPAFRDRVAFRIIAWDDPGADTPMRATLTPQDAINARLPLPSVCDLVIVICWSRMGTPFKAKDGKQYLSGTHWEMLDALASKTTEILVYKRTEEKKFAYNDKAGQEQYERVEEFFKSDLFYGEHGIKSGVNYYSTPADFEKRFETHLEEMVLLLLERAEKSGSSSDNFAPLPDPEPKVAENITTAETNLWQGSPFPGLRAFQEKDAPIYFGRGAETDALVRRVAESRFVEVVGASGSGKSSLVGAGLIPRLRANAISGEATGSKDWYIVRFTPGQGENPFAALFDALIDTFPALRPSPLKMTAEKMDFIDSLQKHPQTLRDTLQAVLKDIKAPQWAEVLLFIDQFEELFTLADARFIETFAALLCDAADSSVCRIVMTIRADFSHRLVEIPALTELLNRGTFHLAPPKRDALKQMIELPAEQAALTFEPKQLVDRILDDTGSDPGVLALMAYALDELYKIAEQRRDKRLTIADYDTLRGVQGAIGTRAESVFAALNLPDKEAILQRVFRELVDVDERGTATRRRAPLSRFTDSAAELVQAFISARLLTVDIVGAHGNAPSNPPVLISVVEVAHEALFREWKLLKNWIEEAQEDFILLRKLRQAAHDWHADNRPAYRLWTHELLAPVYAMQERHNFDLDDLTHAFIKPEAERRLHEFINDRREHRRLNIIDRWVEIGEIALPILIQALEYDDKHIDAFVTALSPYKSKVVPIILASLQNHSALNVILFWNLILLLEQLVS